MSVRIGNQTSVSASSIVEPFEYAISQGFDAFEWFPDKKASGAGWQEEDLDPTARKSIKTMAAQHGVTLTLHAPLVWTPLDASAEVLFDKDLALSKDIGVQLLNIHLTLDQGVDAFLNAIAPFAKKLAQADIMLSIENTPATPPSAFNELFNKIAKRQPSASKHIGMCLDLGHANLCETTRNDYLRYLDLLQHHVPIVHIHMHENYGDRDAHLPLFTGPSSQNNVGIVGFVKRMTSRNFAGTIILEQWPKPPSLLNEARNRLLTLWNKERNPHANI